MFMLVRSALASVLLGSAEKTANATRPITTRTQRARHNTTVSISTRRRQAGGRRRWQLSDTQESNDTATKPSRKPKHAHTESDREHGRARDAI